MQNRKIFSSLLAAALVSLASAAAVSAQAADAATNEAASPSGASSYTDDAMITTMVKAALAKDKEVQSLKISVTTEQGVVKMSGVVPNAEAGKHALQVAAAVRGVKDVKNELTVKSAN